MTYSAFVKELKEISLLGSVGAVLGWDERVQMPVKGASLRADQLALLAGMIHGRFTSDKIGDWLGELESTKLDGDAAVNVRETRREYNRAKKMPTDLVEELTRTGVLAQQAWAEARSKSDFKTFQPWLEKTLALKLREAACVGFKAHPYDALLDEFEPGDTTADLTKVFAELRGPLVELVAKVKDSGKTVRADVLTRCFPTSLQEQFSREAATAVGFDFSAGRLDVSLHPFCSGIGPGDTRMTTRYDEHFFGDAFFGVLHETGHGLYNQGLPAEHFGTPRGAAISLGIHESQSRMWENQVGRGRPFWTHFFPRAKELFPQALADVTPDEWYRAINPIQPSLIRTESDQATYNLHILLRFELEQAMVTQSLSVADLPGAWNERMKNYLGVTVPDDAHGVLQDIHWSGGAIGYFPTYTLGNLYAAQMFEAAQSQLPGLNESLAAGEFHRLLTWLRDNVHTPGQTYSARELIQRISGKPLSAGPLLKHLQMLGSEVYRV